MSDDIDSGKMNSQMIDALLAQPILARLATADPLTHRPHVVPVWFAWDGSSIWISSFSSTRKIRDLKKNPYCSIAIDTAESGQTFQAVVMEGRAELVTQPAGLVHEMTTRIYTRYLGPEGVLAPEPQSWIVDPENLLVKLTPEKTLGWYSQKKGE